MPLSMASPGKRLIVTGFRGGLGMRKRLADLGLNIGIDIQIVSMHPCGPLLVEIKGARYAIGRGLAHHITVEPIAVANHQCV